MQAGAIAHREARLDVGVSCCRGIRRRVDGHAVRTQDHAGHAERLTQSRDQSIERILAAEHAAGDVGQGLGFGHRPGCDSRSPGRLIDDDTHQYRDDHEDHEGKQVQRVGDGDPIERIHEEEVQDQARSHGSDEGGPDATDECDHDDEQLECQHVARHRFIAAERAENPGQQRQSCGDQQEADHPAAQG